MAWHPGDPVVLREIWRGRVFDARPATVVRDAEDGTAVYVSPDTRVKAPVGKDGLPLRLPDRWWTLVNWRRSHSRILGLAWPDVSYAVLMRWDAGTDAFLGWYLNLQTPLRRTVLGFDYTDHFLDVVVDPDRSWRWKDEDELEHAVERELVSEAEAREIRAEGERAIARIEARVEPFDDRWVGWRPDPLWTPATLPPGWDASA